MARLPKNEVNLTDAFAAAAKCKEGAPYTIYTDADKSFFALRVMPSGVKSWLMRTKGFGEKSFASTSEMDAASARVKAAYLLERRKAGVSVKNLLNHDAVPSETPKNGMTLRAALKNFANTRHPAASTFEGMTTTLNVYGKSVLDVPMQSIDREVAIDVVKDAWERSNRQGDLLKQYVNRLYKLEQLKSPFANIANKWKSGGAPFCVPPQKMPGVLDAIEQLRNMDTRDVVWTAMYSGFRPLAVVTMTWKNLNLEDGNATYFIEENAPGFKNGESWHYPIPEVLAERLRRRKGRGEFGDWVFASSKNDDHVNNYRDAIQKVAELSGLPELTPYNLRDTRGTYSERYFGNTLITQRMLNHRPDYVPDSWVVAGKKVKTSDSTHRYVHTSETEMRSYVESYANVVQELGGLKPMSNAVRDIFVSNKAVPVTERIPGFAQSTVTPPARDFAESQVPRQVQQHPENLDDEPTFLSLYE